MRPTNSEFAPFYAGYVSLVPEPQVLPILEHQPVEIADLFGSVPAARETFRYEPGKWSIREMLRHIVDAERVFGFRAFCFSRGEQQALPGFDQDVYIANGAAHSRQLRELIDEFTLVRTGNLRVLNVLSDEDWARTGTASGHPVSVRGLGYIMAGHVRHHCKMLRERYFSDPQVRTRN